MVQKFLYWFILLLVTGIIFLYLFFQSTYMQKKVYPLRYEDQIIRYSEESGLDPHLVMGIIWAESKFNPNATSNKDAKGLMQIIPRTGSWIAGQVGISQYDDEMLYDPETNIMFGCWYFAYLLKVFDGDTELALASYNGGMGNVMKWLKDNRYSDNGKQLKDIPFKETSDYLERVMEARERYINLYEI